jgi:hypothetical protein
MLNIEHWFELSRTYCIPICAILVPANLLATLQTMIFAGFGQSTRRVYIMAVGSGFYALLLLLHVFTWFAIGVVMAPTYILTCLGFTCITINICALLYKHYWATPLALHQIWLRD